LPARTNQIEDFGKFTEVVVGLASFVNVFSDV
jgi:hypothetical protein